MTASPFLIASNSQVILYRFKQYVPLVTLHKGVLGRLAFINLKENFRLGQKKHLSKRANGVSRCIQSVLMETEF